MDQLSNLAPALRIDDCLFNANTRDAYHHLRLRKEDQLYLSSSVGGEMYVPASLNCGLFVALWFYRTKCDYAGAQSLEILEVVVDARYAVSPLPGETRKGGDRRTAPPIALGSTPEARPREGSR
jgi:hypothetical protein